MWAGHQQGGPAGIEETSVNWALGGLQRFDHASDTAWPYGNPRWTQGRPGPATDPANLRALPRWRLVPTPTFAAMAVELDGARALIATVGQVYAAWRRADGLVDAPPAQRTIKNHAVLVVGTVSATAERPQALIIKNSWGAGWGDGGYGYMTQGYVDSYIVRCHVLEP